MAAPLASGLLGARWATEIAQAPPRRYLVSDSNVTRDYRWDCHGSPGPLADSARLITMPVGASHFRRLHRAQSTTPKHCDHRKGGWDRKILQTVHKTLPSSTPDEKQSR